MRNLNPEKAALLACSPLLMRALAAVSAAFSAALRCTHGADTLEATLPAFPTSRITEEIHSGKSLRQVASCSWPPT